MVEYEWHDGQDIFCIVFVFVSYSKFQVFLVIFLSDAGVYQSDKKGKASSRTAKTAKQVEAMKHMKVRYVVMLGAASYVSQCPWSFEVV